MSGDGLSVSGGAGGINAHLDDMQSVAGLLQHEGAGLGSIALGAQRLLLDGTLAASAVLDPGGAARCEAAVLAAVDGPHGVTAVAAELEFLGVRLWAAQAAYRFADQTLAEANLFRHWATGFAAPLAAAAAAAALLSNPLTALPFIDEVAHTDWQSWIAHHPGIVNEVAADSPGTVSFFTLPLAPFSGLFTMVTGHSPTPLTVSQAAALVALGYPDGHGNATLVGSEAPSPATPQDFSDILNGLADRNDTSRGDQQGQIDVRIITTVGPDGTVRRSYIVDIPGTKDWQLDPTADRSHPNDLGSNLHGVAGDDTARQEGVLRALRQAGAGPNDPVLLVGHSQGGLVAMSAAETAARTGEFHVTHVITAGAPIAGSPVPHGTQVLSLENSNDTVPQLDGKANDDADNHVTVTFSTQTNSVGGNHDMRTTYAAHGNAVDHSTNPSVQRYLDGMRGTFTGTTGTVTTTVYDITRTP